MPRISLLLAKDPTGVAPRHLKEKSSKTCPAFFSLSRFCRSEFRRSIGLKLSRFDTKWSQFMTDRVSSKPYQSRLNIGAPDRSAWLRPDHLGRSARRQWQARAIARTARPMPINGELGWPARPPLSIRVKLSIAT